MKECDLADVQETRPHHQIYINKVGIKNVRIPVMIRQKTGGHQDTIADFSLYVDLHPDKKGTHMSRFIIELQECMNIPINAQLLMRLNKQLCDILESKKSCIRSTFSYFLIKEAPVSKLQGIMDYKCTFNVSYDCDDDEYIFILSVNAPVTSLCPCSKEISEYGAHNQRSNVTIHARINIGHQYVWIEDLIDIIEKSASCEIYSVLKRPDEKYVTEKAYENPVFCEDIVRNVADKLNKNKNILGYHVISENHESIHNHIASAEVYKNWFHIT